MIRIHFCSYPMNASLHLAVSQLFLGHADSFLVPLLHFCPRNPQIFNVLPCYGAVVTSLPWLGVAIFSD